MKSNSSMKIYSQLRAINKDLLQAHMALINLLNCPKKVHGKLYGNPKGFTLIEMVVVIALMSILIGTASINLLEFNDPAKNAASATLGFLKRARGKALNTTSAYTVKPASSYALKTTIGTSCTATQTDDTSLVMDLPDGASLGATNWSICYSSRGLSDTSIDISLSDSRKSYTVQVLLGGGLRIL